MMGVNHIKPAFPSRTFRRFPLLFLATLALFRCDFFDIFPPEIEIVTPKEGTSYFATLPIELKATDNRRVDKVEVFVNGTSVHEFTKSPYTTDISLAGVSSPATLQAIAHDQAGNSSDASMDVNVTIGLRLTAPNGGETWAEQSSQTITWESSGSVGSTVSLHYSTDGGSTWDEITTSTANNGTYAWTLPNFIETQSACKIKVSTSQYADVSDDTFTISAEPNTLILTSPNGGETWAEQSTQTVTWSYSGDVGDHVSLGYSIDGGTSWTEIIASTSNDGSHAWNIPNFLDTKSACRVKVASTSTAFADTSDADFTITTEPNFISLTSPNGGEIWAEQSTQTILWTYGGDVGDYVSLHLSLDNGSSWNQIVASTPNDGSYDWSLPNLFETASTCLMRVNGTTTSFADTSAAAFAITGGELTLTSPNGGENWWEWSTQTITWTTSGDVGDYVSLYYSLDGGVTWTQIIASTPNDGSHPWTLPNLTETATTCRLRINSTSTSFGDTSDVNFTITDRLYDDVVQKLLGASYFMAPDYYDYFGISVAINGEYAIVGAYADDAGGSNAGAAYIIHPIGTDIYDRAKILAPDAQNYDNFGISVAISGDYAIVGAYLEDAGGTDAGAAYIYHRTGTNSWDGGVKLTAPDAQADDQFGWSVAISGDYAIVGARYEDAGGTGAGAAYVFLRTGTNSWDGGVKLTAPDAQASDLFGWSVAISGDYAIVGARDEDAGGTAAGAAYVFQRTGANSWDGGTKIVAPDAQASDWFGHSVAISGDYAIVGAYGEDAGGGAYVFYRTGLSSWDGGTKIVAPDAQAGDGFGISVAISGEYAIVGAAYKDHEYPGWTSPEENLTPFALRSPLSLGRGGNTKCGGEVRNKVVKRNYL